jgi:hypothetical protein
MQLNLAESAMCTMQYTSSLSDLTDRSEGKVN